MQVSHTATMHHMHADGVPHTHAMTDQTSHDANMDDHAAAPVLSPHNDNGTDQHKNVNTPRCCGLVTLSAIPASEIVLVKPEILTSRCEIETCARIADRSPVQLYRPPIS